LTNVWPLIFVENNAYAIRIIRIYSTGVLLQWLGRPLACTCNAILSVGKCFTFLQ